MAKFKEKTNNSIQTEENEAEGNDQDLVNNINEESLELKIKTMGQKSGHKSAPTIGYFPSGYNPLKNSGEDTHPNAGVKIYRRVDSRNPGNPRMQLVVGPSGPQVKFVGTNYSGEAATPQLCNYALGILDKETRELKMVPVTANRANPRKGPYSLQGTRKMNELATNTKEVIALNYTTLPYELRDCFLYLGIFPAAFEIPA